MDKDLINEKFKNTDEKLSDHEKRISKLEDTYSTLQAMNLKISNVESDIKEMKSFIQNNTNEKGKKWDKLVDYLFYFVIATILGYVAIKLGLK